jgi:hypothetical protein
MTLATRLSVNHQAQGADIMTFKYLRAAALLAPAAITAALATPAAAAAASPSWQLTDQYTAHPACFTTGGGTEYLELNLSGSWSTPLTFGASGLPAGGSYSDVILYENLATGVWTPGALPIPPGSSNGTGPFTDGPQTIDEAYPVTTIPAGLQANSTFTITFWASEGTTKQTESVPIVIKTSCKRRY